MANLITADQVRIDIGDYKTDRVRIEGIKRALGTITSRAPDSWDYEVRGSYGNWLGVADDNDQALRMIVEAWNKARMEAEST